MQQNMPVMERVISTKVKYISDACQGHLRLSEPLSLTLSPVSRQGFIPTILSDALSDDVCYLDEPNTVQAMPQPGKGIKLMPCSHPPRSLAGVCTSFKAKLLPLAPRTALATCHAGSSGAGSPPLPAVLGTSCPDRALKPSLVWPGAACLQMGALCPVACYPSCCRSIPAALRQGRRCGEPGHCPSPAWPLLGRTRQSTQRTGPKQTITAGPQMAGKSGCAPGVPHCWRVAVRRPGGPIASARPSSSRYCPCPEPALRGQVSAHCGQHGMMGDFSAHPAAVMVFLRAS